MWHNGLVPLRVDDITDAAFAEILREAHSFTDTAARALHFAGGSFQEIHAQLLHQGGIAANELGLVPTDVDCLVYPNQYEPLKLHSGVSGIYNEEVLRIQTEGAAVHALQLRSGVEIQLAPDDILVLCGGALGTPGSVSTLVQDDSVGLGLVDHPMGFVGKVRFKPRYRDAASKIAWAKGNGLSHRSPIRVKSECGRFTGCAFLWPSATMDNKLSIHKFKSLLGASSGLSRVKNALDKRLVHPDILLEIVTHLTKREYRGDIYSILFIGEQKRGAHRVFNRSGQLVIDWTVAEEEVRIIRGMLDTLVRRLEPALEDANVRVDVDNDWLWSCAHHSGTISAGPNGLVDAEHRLTGFDNVYVCDASVIQEHSYANTGLTITEFAERLAHHLLMS